MKIPKCSTCRQEAGARITTDADGGVRTVACQLCGAPMFEIQPKVVDALSADSFAAAPRPPAEVFLAYYHTGFTDDAPVLLAACATKAAADAAIAEHKLTTRDFAYDGGESWWVKSEPVRNN